MIRKTYAAAGLAAILAVCAFAATQAPTAWAQSAPPANADPYANNANAGTQQFPLAAKAGTDSGAAKTAQPGRSTPAPSIPRPGNTAPPSTRPPARSCGIP